MVGAFKFNVISKRDKILFYLLSQKEKEENKQDKQNEGIKAGLDWIGFGCVEWNGIFALCQTKEGWMNGSSLTTYSLLYYIYIYHL